MKEEKPTMHHGASPVIFKNAFQLRERQTKAEAVLWERVRKKQVMGLRFRRQHPISKYILDFYCHKTKLAVEIDGGYHNSPEQKEADHLRTKDLEEMGVRVIRFTNEQVLDDVEGVVGEIESACAAP